MLDVVLLRILIVALAGWVNRHQLEVIEYLRRRTATSRSTWAGAACG